MILLELTSQELETLKMAVIFEGYRWRDNENKDISETLVENNIRACNSIWAKLDRASQPQEDVLITAKDLFQIISMAKKEYGFLRADLHLSNKPVEENDYKHISLASAVIMWLNGHSLLKKVAKFEFTDTSSEFEETEE